MVEDEILEILAWIGFVVLCYMFLRTFLSICLELCCHRRVNIRSFDWGWVAITGATDGIGRGFADVLAAKGFKIILISRNLEKLQSVSSDIKRTTGNNNIEIVQADFGKSHKNPVSFYKGLCDELQKWEISVLINNVGVAYETKFGEHTESDLENMLGVNIYPQTMLSYYLIPRMQHSFRVNGKKCLMINLASSAGEFCIEGMGMYGATKKYDEFLSRGLRYEYRNEIEIISAQPFFVATQMPQYLGFEKKNGLTQISPEAFANSVLAQLHKGRTTGHIWHKIQHWNISRVPEYFQPKVIPWMLKISKKI